MLTEISDKMLIAKTKFLANSFMVVWAILYFIDVGFRKFSSFTISRIRANVVKESMFVSAARIAGKKKF